MTKEEKFFKALQDIFIGAKVEGKGGFVNLMKIKSNYYNKIETLLKEDIEKALEKYPAFREELFDKLYSFFNRYFTESGSIYFNSTPFHNNIYEKVYTDDRDVILFWKTRMLYYVKTDRIFRSMPIELPSSRGVGGVHLPSSRGVGGVNLPSNRGVGGVKFYFDASTIENKKSNEKRSLIYELKEIKEDKTIVFNVYYSEKGRITKTDDIIKQIKNHQINIDEETLERAFKIFEKQSEVDFFINKNAKVFLQEQFKLWSYQYFWEGAKEWSADRVNQLQILKDISFKIIGFISQFEDELLKIWNKPKFVKNSNYVITLDRIFSKLPSSTVNEGVQFPSDRGVRGVHLPSDRGVGGVQFPSDRGVRGVYLPDIPKWYELPYNPELKERARELRKAGNKAEIIFWKQVRNKQFLGLDFDRQKIVGNYIVDFYCKYIGVVIEIDGESHNEKEEYDANRDEYLKSFGLKVYHIRAEDVINDIDSVMRYLEAELSPLVRELTTQAFQQKGKDTPLSPLQEGNLVERILKHPNINIQIKEWQELGIVDKEFKVEDIFETDLTGMHLSKKYEHLPIDTKYFKDLELEILSLFDDLDNSLDGWLIKSENYQALNTLLPKFREKVQTIYIDPPFNLDSSDQFLYRTNYKDSNWATLLENRLRIAKEWLNEKGSIFVRCDYNGNWIVRCLMDEIFGKENFRNEIIINKSIRIKTEGNKFPTWHDSFYFYSKNGDDAFFRHITEKRQQEEWRSIDTEGESWEVVPESMLKFFSKENLKRDDHGNYITRARIILGKEIVPRDGRRFPSQKVISELEKQGRLRLSENNNPQMLKPNEIFLTDNWSDTYGYASEWDFPTENSELGVMRCIEATSYEKDIVLDFFLGSGTTTAVAHKLGRKWIGVEMGEHFYTVVLPRMKKVLAYDKSGISKELKTPRQTSSDTPLTEGIYEGGGFFKYYELEQYEETLANTVYENHDLVIAGNKSPYEQYIFLKDEKMLKALEIDYENNKVKVDLNKLYENIDIAETLSNLTGKWIKKINPDNVEFADGSIVNTKEIDYKLIKPLIWWE